MKPVIKHTALSVCLALTLGSCNDFFEILPLNEIVLENYYTEEGDITSVINACYAGLESEDCLLRMAAWGEFRSDNVSVGASAPEDETQLLKENILPTSKFTDWSSFYTVINRCNTVIHYAPVVQQKDPNYTYSELKANIAEVKALRALCYFYLIRTFKDVPFLLEPSLDDDQEYFVGVTPFETILDTLILDLENVKDEAIKRYATPSDNTSKITRYSIYALLADMYLWKGDYQKCVEYCQTIMDYKYELYEEEFDLRGNNTNIKLYKGYPLISENMGGSYAYSGEAYTAIFGEKNSFESIFELHFERNQPISNTLVSRYYGSSSSTSGYVSATPFLVESVATGANKIFRNTDCRYIESIRTQTSSGMYPILKYVASSISFTTPTASMTTTPGISYSTSSTNYSNWIVYRLSDIMLMKAEALLQLSKIDTTSSRNSNLRTSFNLVQAVFNRANNLTDISADTLKFATYATSILALEDLVLAERQRELLFEGKRWFDLMRMARQRGNNTDLIVNVIKKQKANTMAIQTKLADVNRLYFPYSETELKKNPLMTQNPAYLTDQSTSLTD